MDEVALAIGVRREPERERGEFIEDRQEFERTVLSARLLRRRFLGVASVAQGEIWQRRDAHRHRQIRLVRIGEKRAQRDWVAFDPHHARRGDQLGALTRHRAVRGHGEDVVARPDGVVAGLPALSSGSFRFPHFGDWTHDGQPCSQGQPANSLAVSCTQPSKMSKPRWVIPTPPEWPS